MDLNASAPRLRREQVAGMNIHYIMWSLDYFLDVQQRLGFKTIELWAAEPHVTLDHTGYFEADKLRRKIESRGLSGSSLCPENVVYPWQYAARKPLHAQRSLAYFKHGIELAEVLGAPYMSINSGWGDWDEDREEAWKRSARALGDSCGLCRRARRDPLHGEPEAGREQLGGYTRGCQAHA